MPAHALGVGLLQGSLKSPRLETRGRPDSLVFEKHAPFGSI